MTRLSRKRFLVSGICLLLLTLAASGPLAHAGNSEQPPAAGSKPVDINRADEAELTSVPGIGKATAQRIIAFREQHGPFGRVDDLMKVKGIGEKSLEKLRPFVTVTRRG